MLFMYFALSICGEERGEKERYDGSKKSNVRKISPSCSAWPELRLCDLVLLAFAPYSQSILDSNYLLETIE